MKRNVAASGLAALLFFPLQARAADLTILVAPAESTAFSAAKAAADGTVTVAESKLFKAFDQAAEHLVGCGACTVTIKVAAGEYKGKAGSSTWLFPETVAPQATLRLLGGYDDSFQQRSPFSTPTSLLVGDTRSAPVLVLEGKKHALKELYLSGFAFEVSPGNRYDQKTNSLLKGSSSSWPILQLGYLTVERLVLSDNVFMNAANAVASPLIRAASPNAEVRVANNVFLNNVFTWQVGSANFRHVPRRYVVEHNSFIRNWPYNPDATTSNPGALQLGNKRAAAKVEVSGNLFVQNVGGAIFPEYDDKAGPKLAIRDNLFFGNGQLFEAKEPGDGAVVGKFNRSAKHLSLPVSGLEDFSWEVSGNVALDPRLELPVQEELKPVRYDAAQAQKPDGSPNFELEMEVSLDDYDDGGGDEGLDVDIRNFAPRLTLPPGALPFPTEEKALRYGASPARVEQFPTTLRAEPTP